MSLVSRKSTPRSSARGMVGVASFSAPAAAGKGGEGRGGDTRLLMLPGRLRDGCRTPHPGQISARESMWAKAVDAILSLFHGIIPAQCRAAPGPRQRDVLSDIASDGRGQQ